MRHLYASLNAFIFMPLLLAVLPGQSQNLVVNPGAENGPPSTTGWTAVSSGSTCTVGGGWRIPSGSSGYPTAASGSYFFNPGCGGSTGGVYELRQDIDVSARATAIDAHAYRISFSGYTRSFDQPSPDQTNITVEYLNAAKNSVLGFYTTGTAANTAAWVNYTNVQLAPVGTRFVRVRLIATWQSGDAIDSYFDDISISGLSVLPVDLLAFTAETKNARVSLQWRTANERNLTGFHILRSPDGLNWRDIGFIAANAGTQATNEYLFTDDAPLPGAGFYRLQQTDLDGKSTLSKVVAVNPAGMAAVGLYPNPAKDKLFFNSSQPVLSVEITDNLGRVLERQTGVNVISVGHLRPGTYIIKVNGRTFTGYKQFVKE